ncbi:MAG: PilZ domain-containing protein [Proteobacteria bacterium]|nr:PilZ domain-containing protein [Pseudomonadota bacterium]
MIAMDLKAIWEMSVKMQAQGVTDKRRFERHSLMLEAKVSFDDESLACVIIDISAGGVRVRMKETKILLDDDSPKSVILYFPQFGGFKGEVVWTNNLLVGIKFHENHEMMEDLILKIAAQDAS